jgi:outer membrane receptor protein involved in Fe transport
MKNVFTFLLILGTTAAMAQMPSGAPRGNMRMGAIGRVYGKLIEANTKEPIAYASVAVYSMATKKDSIIGGALTLDNGDFSIEGLPLARVKIRFSFMGFKQKDQMVVLMPPDNVELDMGNLTLESTAQNLKEVTVKAEKSTMQMNIDRKVVNVDKNLVASGGTAEDVLKNVPSVTVDMDGKPSLRNAETTIYMDGRPTALTLNQIPADQIDQVEIITNPSAKFDANLTGGILNLVMKKNKKPGYNGMVNAGIGTSGQRNAMLSLNIKQSPIGISLMYNVNQRGSLNKGYINRQYITDYAEPYSKRLEQYSLQQSLNDFSNTHQMARLGLDYSINNRNTLTVAGMTGGGNFNINSDQTFNELGSKDSLIRKGLRHSEAVNQFRHRTVNLTWKRTYPKKGEELVVDGQYQYSNNTNLNELNTNSQYHSATGIIKDSTDWQKNKGGGEGRHGQIQLDYTNPLNDSSKLEWGAKTFYREATTDINVYKSTNTNPNNPDKFLSNHYVLTDMINALYVNYSSRYKGIAFQAGVRFEQSNFTGTFKVPNKVPNVNSELKDTLATYNYPSDGQILKSLFPSLYLSKKLNEGDEIQLNFSRKIRRAQHMEIMAIPMPIDQRSYRIGNPNLKPELINLTEVNYNTQFGDGSNWLSTLYGRFVEDPILSFATNDTISGFLINSFKNANLKTEFGLDNSLRYIISKNLDISWNLNVFKLKLISDSKSVEGWAYNSKANFNWKLPKDFTVQLSGNYESERVLLQGLMLPNYFADFAVKKTLFKVASLTFSVSDIFDSRRMLQHLDIDKKYLQMAFMRRDVRFFKISFSMPFGKPDASIFKNRRKPQQQQQQEMDF